MKELDIVMTQYLDDCYEIASELEKESFKYLLDMQDPDLYALLLGQQTCPDNDVQRLLVTLRTLKSAP
jgi:antitoxin CptB